MSIEAQLPQPDEVVDGKYRIERLLGRGGMGAVFVARHVQTQRKLALKCMLAGLIGDYEAEQRFIREAKLAGTVDHPGVVATYDIGRHRGSLYMVMELLSGESLSARIGRGPIPLGEAAHLMMTVLAAVSAAHQKGIVHRDLKPDNIFLHRAPDGVGYEPKILDFGISKAINPDGQPTMGLTKTGMVLGTPLYMSPEQVRGAKATDHRTDVYALGVIMYEMLTGKVPYDGNNFADLVLKIVTGNCDPPSARSGAVPPALDAIVMRAMHPDLDARFADAAAFSRALAAFAVAPTYASQRPRGLSSAPPARVMTPIPSQAPVTPQALTPFVVEAREERLPVKPFPWPIVAVAAVVVLGVGAWLLLGGEPPAPVASPVPPLVAAPVSAAQPSAPSTIVPNQPLMGVPDSLPSGVSADALPPPSPVPSTRDVSTAAQPRAAHTDRSASLPVQPATTVVSVPAPAELTPVQAAPAAPAAAPVQTAPEPELPRPRWEPERPPNDQVIDPFE